MLTIIGLETLLRSVSFSFWCTEVKKNTQTVICRKGCQCAFSTQIFSNDAAGMEAFIQIQCSNPLISPVALEV